MIRGTISTIIYKGNDNFIICSIKTKDMPIEYIDNKNLGDCIVKGNMLVCENLEYEFDGQWVNDATYGWQFKATSYKEILPDGKDRYAMISYLQSEMFNGIGIVMATRLVDYFGEETLDIIKTQPERLVEVKGISKRKANDIFQSFLQNYQYQEIMMFLKPYGVSTKRILRIMEEYHGDAVVQLKKNPYEVCKKIDGFGFIIADKIAMACGLKRRDNARIQEGIKYVLEQVALEKGDLFLNKEALGQNLSSLLNKDLEGYSRLSLKRKGINQITQELLKKEMLSNFVNTEDVLVAMQEMNDNGSIVVEFHEVNITNNVECEDKINNQIITIKKDDVAHILKYCSNGIYEIKVNNNVCDVSKEFISNIDFNCYLKFYYQVEIDIAKNINRILYATNKKPFTGSFRDIIKKLEQKNGIQYAEKQKEAIMSVIKRNLFIVTGGPGTGKTTLIRGIINLFDILYPYSEIVLAAPTGRAAKRMEETTGLDSYTIHRLLEYKPGLGFCKNNDNPIDADLVIIDETSMVDVVLCNALMRAISSGTKVIFVGDADQLPSVGPGMILKDLINSNKITTIFLNEIFRQTNTSKIVINAQKINKQETDLEFGSDFVFESLDKTEHPDLTNDIIKKLCSTYQKELINNDFDANKIQILCPFKTKGKICTNELNKILAPIANPRPDGEISLNTGYNLYHIGDKVMQLKNNYDKQVFNGDIGFIKDIRKTNNGYYMDILYDTNLVTYDEFDEITLAYATTIHKSQGSEYDVVIEPIAMDQTFFMQKCILYTAITRAKKKYVGIGEYKAMMASINKNDIVRRNTKLSKRIDEFDATTLYLKKSKNI